MCGLYQKCCDKAGVCRACVDHPPRTVRCAHAACGRSFRPDCPMQVFCRKECYENSHWSSTWEAHLEQARAEGRLEPEALLLKLRTKKARQTYRSSPKGKKVRAEAERRRRLRKREAKLRSVPDGESGMRGSTTTSTPSN